MGRVTSEDDTTMAKVFNASTLKPIDGYPLQFKVHCFTKHRADARYDVGWFLLFLRVNISTQLKVDSPHVIWLFVQQRRLTPVKWRVEPKPSFRGKVGFHHDVSDEKVVLKGPPNEIDAHHAANWRASAITRNEPVSLQGIRAFWSLDN